MDQTYNPKRETHATNQPISSKTLTSSPLQLTHHVDTQFCTDDLIKENDLNDHPCTQKIMIALHASIGSCITCINSFIAYHKNDLEILMITTVFLVFKLD